MKGLRQLWLRTSSRKRSVLIAILVIGIVSALAIIRFGWGWTGLTASSQITQVSESGRGSGKTYRAVVYQPGKSLWDILQLLGILAIPVVVAIGGAWYANRQQQSNEAVAADDQHEKVLQGYIDKMSELLLANGLRESPGGSEVRSIARVRTLTVLHSLNNERKRNVIQFLYESGLIKVDGAIVDLAGADLRSLDLSGMELGEADLSRTDLRGAKLVSCRLSSARLAEATLVGCDLADANLIGADVSAADLRGAHFGQNIFLVRTLSAPTSPASISAIQAGGQLRCLRTPSSIALPQC